ncbi:MULTISPECIES: hypothetical protein [Mycobacteriaceae]|uniref:Uncharacterized protein n=3 Tax=Mycobacteriaceae TaxID=1762 RepID=A1UPF7_MYCSK|nr:MULTISPECIES: hypothetical protein [Mycobacteriaceae]MBU8814129.1 hypothetical protein [Mycolicibacterium goodii]MDN4521798.1 hypothetical protein [Mycolicibacterium austroafricanum]
MTTHTDLLAGGRHTYWLGERLAAIATDLLYFVEPGHEELHPDGIPDGLTITAHRRNHTWGSTAQVWARDPQGVLQASAESSAAHPDLGRSISARTRHFRGGGLLWTHTAPVVTDEPINPLDPWSYAAVGRHLYQLRPEYRLDGAPLWQLRTDDLDTEHPRFAGIDSATTHIAEFLEPAPAPSRRRRGTRSA